MLRFTLKTKIPVTVRKRFLGANEDVAADVIALEFYPKSIPTFTVQADGHVFAYLPPHAFYKIVDCTIHNEREIVDLVDVECADSDPSVSVLNITGPGWGRVEKMTLRWERYICSIDWADDNVLIHCVMLYDGCFAFLRNSRFQVGGEEWSPPQWGKQRDEWHLPNIATRLTKTSVCLIVKSNDNKHVLGVSRKSNSADFGLPAGSVEKGEKPLDAIRRELKEETGLDLKRATFLDERRWRDYYVYCYLAEEVSGELLSDDALRAKGEGVARWLNRSDLFSGTFGDYNQTIFQAYGCRID